MRGDGGASKLLERVRRRVGEELSMPPRRCEEHYRHELKYLISYGQKADLNLRLAPLLEQDSHARGGCYMIRSLYFDDWRDRALREKVEQALTRAYGSFTVASALMSPEMLEQALLCPKQSVSLEMSTENVMSVEVPRYEFKLASEDGGNIYPYGFAQTSGELDDAVRELGNILPDLLRLAEIEKATQLLAAEIERTRRRVNALEYVKIPQMQQSIKYITMKLDENERANTIRLMKVKDMILQEAIEERRQTDAAEGAGV